MKRFTAQALAAVTALTLVLSVPGTAFAADRAVDTRGTGTADTTAAGAAEAAGPVPGETDTYAGMSLEDSAGAAAGTEGATGPVLAEKTVGAAVSGVENAMKYGPRENAVEKRGIDVSKYQNQVRSDKVGGVWVPVYEDIDWNLVKASGVQFVIIKCGGAGVSTGVLYEDPCYDRNIKGALAAGLRVGLYFWTGATSVDEAKREAAYAVDLANRYASGITLPIYMDYEYTSKNAYSYDRLRDYTPTTNRAARTPVVQAFCKGIEDGGYYAGVYMNRSTANNSIYASTISSSYKFWIAGYTTYVKDSNNKVVQVYLNFTDQPTALDYSGTYDMWQYSSRVINIQGLKGVYDKVPNANLVDADIWYDDGNTNAIKNQNVYRVYNPNSGEHLYTRSAAELYDLVALGWKSEYPGGWKTTRANGDQVYRVYNPVAGEHIYTTDRSEVTELVKAGWKDEGFCFYSASSKKIPIYRQYNPNEKANNHNYTTDTAERDYLVSQGWKDEGVVMYADAKQTGTYTVPAPKSNTNSGGNTGGNSASSSTSGDYIFPNSATKKLTESDLAGKDAATLRLGRNEIYARHGYIFTSADLKAYFSSKSWYKGTVSDMSSIHLNSVESANVAFIKEHE